MHLSVGDSVRDRIAASPVVEKLFGTNSPPEEIIEQLFIRTLSRRPTRSEQVDLREIVGDAVKEQGVYEDIFWGLLNSSEFTFNH